MEQASLANTATDEATLRHCKAALLAGGAELGLLQQTPAAWFSQASAGAIDAVRVEGLIAERNAARAAKDWATADRVRSEIAALGVSIQDGPQGTQWRVD